MQAWGCERVPPKTKKVRPESFLHPRQLIATPERRMTPCPKQQLAEVALQVFKPVFPSPMWNTLGGPQHLGSSSQGEAPSQLDGRAFYNTVRAPDKGERSQ